jgi:DNA-binding transcriptional regulator YdaS (Cro superfamily)
MGKRLSLSEKDILQMLQEAVDKAGSQSEWCRRHGISRPHLNKVLNGRKALSPSIRKALKIKTIYVREQSSRVID